MTPEDARDYVEHFTPAQRAIIASANGVSPTLLHVIEEGNRNEHWNVRREADQLEAMNLLQIRQSRSGGQFFYNYVILNERGLQVQELLRSKAKRK